jgi:hypothetical protein
MTAITPDHQKFMAFESLLGWTAAVVNQAQRVSAAQQEFLTQIRRRSDLQAGQRREVASVPILSQRLAQQSFQTVMRDMNEHTIEYFEGNGHRPHDWVYRTARLGRIGRRLLAKISRLGPFYPPRQTLPEHRGVG